MSVLYFDIETLPLEKGADKQALSPETAKVAALTVYDVDARRGVVYIENGTEDKVLEPGWQVKGMTEQAIVTEFWLGVQQYDVLVGFGLRRFDIPFLTHRSLAQKVKPVQLFRKEHSVDRQDFPKIVDLQDEFSFYGNMQQPLSLQSLAKLNGVDRDGVCADYESLATLLSAGKERKLINHCRCKSQITVDLFEIWKTNLASPSFLNSVT